MNRRASERRNASALLLVLWAILLLSSAVLIWAEWIQSGMRLHGIANRSVEAHAMARSGLTIAMHPMVTLRTRIPAEEVAPGMGFEVRVMSEGGRLNLNWLLRGEKPQKINMLKRWLEQRGLDFDRREALVDALLDYVDGDDAKRLNGMEDTDDYHPRNRELKSVEELTQVWGSAPLTSQPGWSDELTVYSQGPIDLQGASLEILRLVPGLGEAQIALFLQRRRGPDGIDGTDDDHLFLDAAELQQSLSLTAAQFQALSELVSQNDLTSRIISIGRSGTVTRKIEVVIRKEEGSPQIMSWKE